MGKPSSKSVACMQNQSGENLEGEKNVRAFRRPKWREQQLHVWTSKMNYWNSVQISTLCVHVFVEIWIGLNWIELNLVQSNLNPIQLNIFNDIVACMQCHSIFLFEWNLIFTKSFTSFHFNFMFKKQVFNHWNTI